MMDHQNNGIASMAGSGRDESPLLPPQQVFHNGVGGAHDNGGDGDATFGYGATSQTFDFDIKEQPSSPSISLPSTPSLSTPNHNNIIDHDVVNHGHPYSDAIVDVTIIPIENNNGSIKSKHGEQSVNKASYWSLIRDNANFRWYLMSYLVTHAGEWFTYVASISAIEQIHSLHNTTSRTSISILVSLRLLPNALFTTIGGVLADSYDRRVILFTLDLLGSCVALLFLLAYHLQSITALYIATALQMTVAAIYEPNRSAIVSMLVRDEEHLKKAITVSSLAWSVMTSVGSSLGGFSAEYWGIEMCFVMDSISYVVSALFLWRIRGSYVAEEMEKDADSSTGLQHDNNDNTSCCSPSQFTNMTMEGLRYLRSQPWGPFVFFKFCAALIYGAADVLNVSFSERSNTGDDVMLEGSSHRLGVLFAAVGVGCFLGPVIIDHFTRMEDVRSLERACVGSFLLMVIGCYGLSQVESFPWLCVYTSVRSAGSSVIWVHSSLLLQKFSSGSMLGRVMSVDYSLATLSEAFSAMCGGVLQDDVGLSAEQVSFLMSLVGLGTLAMWSFYLNVARV